MFEEFLNKNVKVVYKDGEGFSVTAGLLTKAEGNSETGYVQIINTSGNNVVIPIASILVPGGKIQEKQNGQNGQGGNA